MKKKNSWIAGLAAFALAFALALAGCSDPNGEKTEDTIPRYTVTFNTMGGSAIDEQTVKENSSVNKPAAPAWTAFDFGGWFYADGSAVTWPVTVTADIMVYARLDACV